MNEIVEHVISSVQKAKKSFCKFISANDAGTTGAHQSGYYIPKNAISLLFDQPGQKGSNSERFVTIKWQNDFETNSRFIYYGTGTRNEYRVTRFGKGFPYLSDDSVGNLLILSHISDDYYEAFVLESDDDFETFFIAFNINANETNRLIPKTGEISLENTLLNCFNVFIGTLNNQFPPTQLMAENARRCYNSVNKITRQIITQNPDINLLNWLEAEFELFKILENNVYAEQIEKLFSNVGELVAFANTILNRRKSRAGKSLEYHLEEIFRNFDLNFDTQIITEGNKKPDFIFPGYESYHNSAFNEDNLIFLASKTTCKDRWRQIINEADRVKIKHLFTLQQGISINQLKEMTQHHVKLVVPAPYIRTFPEQFRHEILSLDQFITHVKHIQ